ncbi:MAG: hypothetical protein ACK5ZW_15015, partial [Betaproteobacteria bacterium]
TGLWVRRVRRPDAFFFIKNSLLPDRSRSGIVPGVSTYSVVQICGTTSVRRKLFWIDYLSVVMSLGHLRK